jgi:negative regulator of replication initiation
MTDAKEAWEKAGTDLQRLGELFRRQQDASATPPPDPQEVSAAAKNFADSVRDSVDAVSATVTSEEFKEQGRTASASVLDALAASFTELGEAVRRASQQSPPAPPAQLPPVDTAPAAPADEPPAPDTPA